jgi:hypothetical protein
MNVYFDEIDFKKMSEITLFESFCLRFKRKRVLKGYYGVVEFKVFRGKFYILDTYETN